MKDTTGGIEPIFGQPYKRRASIRFMSTVKCDVCAKEGTRLSGHTAPEGWLYGETYMTLMNGDPEVCITYVCSLECCAMFWQPGPGDLYKGKQVEKRQRAAENKTVSEQRYHYCDSPGLKKVNKCPNCGSHRVTDSSQSLDCNQCGHSW